MESKDIKSDKKKTPLFSAIICCSGFDHDEDMKEGSTTKTSGGGGGVGGVGGSSTKTIPTFPKNNGVNSGAHLTRSTSTPPYEPSKKFKVIDMNKTSAAVTGIS